MKGLQSRGIVIGRIGIFGFGFLLLHWTVNFLYTEVVLSHSLVYRVEEQFQQNKEDLSVVFLGDSHPRNSVNPTYMEHAFNFATGGENYIQTYYKLRYYLEEERLDIKTVVLPLDLHSFSGKRSDEFRDNNYWQKYLNYWEIAQVKNGNFQILNFWLDGEMAYWHGADETESFLVNFQVEMEKGFVPRGQIIKSAEGKYIGGMAKARARGQLSRKRVIDEAIVYYFKELLKLCTRNGIQVVFVRYPVTREYYSVAIKIVPIEEYYNELTGIIEEFIDSPIILDFHDKYWDQPNFFGDVDHLNIYGAEDFSSILWEEMKKFGVTP